MVTSFRPEIVNLSDKFYLVSYRNKVSRVAAVDKEAAVTFIRTVAVKELESREEAEEEEEEEENGGPQEASEPLSTQDDE